jgi:hypothetical protein
MHCEKDIPGTDLGLLGVYHLKGVGWTEMVLHDGFHQVSSGAASLAGRKRVLSDNTHAGSCAATPVGVPPQDHRALWNGRRNRDHHGIIIDPGC